MTQTEHRPFTIEDLVQIAHVLPHRVRFQAPLLASRADICRRIAERLAMSPNAIDKVTVRVVTGSIIVEDPHGTLDANVLLVRLRECIQIEAAQFLTATPGSTKIARSVARAFAALNADVRGGLHHRADLAALLPVFLAALAVGQVVTTGRLPAPAWFNFCWWSFRAFLTFHKDAATEENHPPTSP